MSTIALLPRLIRLKDVPKYIGMDRNRFNTFVRPHLIEIPIGKQGVAFDRLDLDAWVDQYKQCSGRPGGKEQRSTKPWDVNKQQDYLKEAKFGISKSKSLDIAFEKALAQSRSRKRSNT
ncbi:TPA: hypothetical protein ACT9NA_002022 [Legionella pneumophila]|uniref:hypothetical protein n=1 Tax=Legionella pneumophila TaxID=446 RepID=UPI001F38AF29|nr:hypothetical protein [Legionella pneumophila]